MGRHLSKGLRDSLPNLRPGLPINRSTSCIHDIGKEEEKRERFSMQVTK